MEIAKKICETANASDRLSYAREPVETENGTDFPDSRIRAKLAYPDKVSECQMKASRMTILGAKDDPVPKTGLLRRFAKYTFLQAMI